MNLRLSTEFVGGPPSNGNKKRSSKFIEILGTVAVSLLAATVTIYGYKEATKEKIASSTINQETEREKLEQDYAKTILQAQYKKIESLEAEIIDLRKDVDVWQGKYYDVLSNNEWKEKYFTKLQEYNKLQKEFDELNQKYLNLMSKIEK